MEIGFCVALSGFTTGQRSTGLQQPLLSGLGCPQAQKLHTWLRPNLSSNTSSFSTGTCLGCSHSQWSLPDIRGAYLRTMFGQVIHKTDQHARHTIAIDQSSLGLNVVVVSPRPVIKAAPRDFSKLPKKKRKNLVVPPVDDSLPLVFTERQANSLHSNPHLLEKIQAETLTGNMSESQVVGSQRLLIAVELPLDVSQLVTKVRDEFRSKYIQSELHYERHVRKEEWPAEKSRRLRQMQLLMWRRDPQQSQHNMAHNRNSFQEYTTQGRWRLNVKHIGTAPEKSIRPLQIRMHTLCQRIRSFEMFVDARLKTWPRDKLSRAQEISLELGDSTGGSLLDKLVEAVDHCVEDWLDYDVPYYGTVKEPETYYFPVGNYVDFYSDVKGKRMQIAKLDYFAVARERRRVALYVEKLEYNRHDESNHGDRVQFQLPSVSLFKRGDHGWERLSEHPVRIEGTI